MKKKASNKNEKGRIDEKKRCNCIFDVVLFHETKPKKKQTKKTKHKEPPPPPKKKTRRNKKNGKRESEKGGGQKRQRKNKGKHKKINKKMPVLGGKKRFFLLVNKERKGQKKKQQQQKQKPKKYKKMNFSVIIQNFIFWGGCPKSHFLTTWPKNAHPQNTTKKGFVFLKKQMRLKTAIFGPTKKQYPEIPVIISLPIFLSTTN